MSVKATIDGETWEFSTVEEAAAFMRLRSTEATPVTPRANRHRVARHTKRPVRQKRVVAKVAAPLSSGSRQILDTVRRSPGLHTAEFAAAIGSPTPKSVPPRMMMLGKELKALGFDPAEVIKRERIYVKSQARSVFTPGPRFEEAIRKVLL